MLAQMAGGLLPRRVANILRKYPQGDAHLFIPGIGRISNFSAGNYSLTDGVSGATVDQTVGRVNDAAGKLGVELMPKGDFSTGASWTPMAGFSIANEMLNLASPVQYAGSAVIGANCTIGKTYRCQFEVKNWVSGRVKYICGGAQGILSAGNGTYAFTVTAISAGEIAYIQAADVGVILSIDNISVKEVIGTHATQGTTNNMPTLRKGAVNLLTYSNDFGNAVWAPSRMSIAAEQLPGPFGETVSAAKLTGLGGGSEYVYRTLSVTTGTSYTYSLFVRQILTTTFTIAANTQGGTVVFSLVGDGGILTRNGVWIDAKIEPMQNGWYRCSGTMLSNATASANTSFGNTALAGDMWHVYAGQAELGPVATPYAPTAGTPASNGVGNYSWEFDGTTDYLKLDAPLFGMADDHCVIAGCNPSVAKATTDCAIFGHRGAGNPMIRLGFSIGKFDGFWRDDAGVYVRISSGAVPYGTSLVASFIQKGKTRRLRGNGSQVGGTDTTQLGTATFTTYLCIGAEIAGGVFFAGNIYPVIAIKGTVSDADLLTLERWVGKMSGVTF